MQTQNNMSSLNCQGYPLFNLRAIWLRLFPALSTWRISSCIIVVHQSATVTFLEVGMSKKTWNTQAPFL